MHIQCRDDTTIWLAWEVLRVASGNQELENNLAERHWRAGLCTEPVERQELLRQK